LLAFNFNLHDTSLLQGIILDFSPESWSLERRCDLQIMMMECYGTLYSV